MYSNYRKRRCLKVGGVTLWRVRWIWGEVERGEARWDGRGEAGRAENDGGRWRRTTRYASARDGNRSAGMGAGTEGEEERCRCDDGHGQDRSVGAYADTDRTGVSVRRRTRTGQECRHEGGHGQDRIVGAEADTDRAGVSARRRTRAGQNKTDDSMRVSKHKLIRKEKRERKQKRKENKRLYTGRDSAAKIIQQQQSNKNYTRLTSVHDHEQSLDPSE